MYGTTRGITRLRLGLVYGALLHDTPRHTTRHLWRATATEAHHHTRGSRAQRSRRTPSAPARSVARMKPVRCPHHTDVATRELRIAMRERHWARLTASLRVRCRDTAGRRQGRGRGMAHRAHAATTTHAAHVGRRRRRHRAPRRGQMPSRAAARGCLRAHLRLRSGSSVPPAEPKQQMTKQQMHV